MHMTRLMKWALLSAVLATALLTGSARADDAPSQTYAVLVGVGEFTDPQIKPRPTAVADAQAVYDLITDKAYLGADPKNVTLLISSKDEKRGAKPATHANVLDALAHVGKVAKQNDLVLVALIGQGGPVRDRTCYFTTDSTAKGRAKDALTATEVEKALEHLKSHRAVALIDINYKGFEFGKDESVVEPNLLDMVRVFVGPEDKEEHALPPGRVVLLSSKSVAPPIDLAKHGLFTQVVLEGLKGAADTEGYEPDGVVTVDEIIAYLDKEFQPLARKEGKTREQREQSPLLWAGRSSHFVLTKNPKVTPLVEKRLAKLADLTEKGDISKEVAAEGKGLLSRMPKLKSQQSLRKEYQKLVDGTETAKAFTEARAELIAASKLDRSAATAFARKVLDGFRVLDKEYVKELNQGEMVANAVRTLYRRLDEKLPAEIKKRLENAKEMSRTELLTLLTDVRLQLGKREDLADGKDVDLGLYALVSNLDPYTTYIDPESMKRVQIDLEGNFVGIGIQIRRDIARDGLLIISPIKGSPAYKAGLKAGDLIVQIIREVDSRGKPLAQPEVISTKGLRVDDAVKKILGEVGTPVKVVIERQGLDKPKEFEIVRGRVEVETVLGVRRNSDDSWDFYLDPESKIAYIRLTQFGPRSADQITEVVKKLDKQGIKGLVFDLRFNPGGLLTAAVRITDLFIDDGLIVTIRPRVGEEQSYGGKHEDSFLNFPMVCLVNGGSASGSEIVAAALQDHDRAVILGSRTYGKGSVQNIQDFKPTGGKIKLTTASYWRPNGKNINKSSTKGTESEDWGVLPNKGFKIVLDPKERDDLESHLRDQEIVPNRDLKTTPSKTKFKDRQLEAAVSYLKDQIKMASKTPTKKAG